MIAKNIGFVLLVSVSILFTTSIRAQESQQPADDAWKKVYRATATKLDDLISTKLDVKFDFDKSYMYGKEWVTLKPHFYPTDTLELDAKGMDIHKIEMVREGKDMPLKFDYDGMTLRIHLDRVYARTERYTLYIDYTSKPNELKIHRGSAAITDAKGLYFINPKGEEKDKPTQIWTQGETESNSVWFPTIDKLDRQVIRHQDRLQGHQHEAIKYQPEPIVGEVQP